MSRWEQSMIGPDSTLRDALIVIDRTGTQMALVVDAQRRLLGTLSDGDVRRGLIQGMDLDAPVGRAMHTNPLTGSVSDSRDVFLGLMRKAGIHQLPIVDAGRRVVGLELLDEFFAPRAKNNWVVLMAGGLGARLRELTESTPKPMLLVGGRPLLETIMRGFIDQGFRRFYFAVNYKAEVIERHFGDGQSMGVEISYLRETKRMGTAGALSLLPEAPSDPILVANGDLLVKADFGEMLDEHVRAGAAATMAVREYEFQIPYGVVRHEAGTIAGIEEKPIQRSLVSAGIYVLSPPVLNMVPRGAFYDMPMLFEELIARGAVARCYTVRGYWMDVGRLQDYQQANNDFPKEFG